MAADVNAVVSVSLCLLLHAVVRTRLWKAAAAAAANHKNVDRLCNADYSIVLLLPSLYSIGGGGCNM